jgi:hypothetical protein
MPWKRGPDDDTFVLKHATQRQWNIMYFYTKNVVLTEDQVSHL